MIFRALSVLAVLAVLAANPAHAALSDQQRQQILSEAREAYNAGLTTVRKDPQQAALSFADAARRFQQLVDEGVVNGRLEYNLGNALLQMGEVGRSIQHSRAAENLIPGDPKLRHNLEYARSLTQSHIAPSGGRALSAALLGWHRNTTIRARFTVFITAYLVFWLLLTVSLVAPRPWWWWPVAATGVVWLACGLSVGADLLGTGHYREGVVLLDDVVVRKGNSEGFEPQFQQPLHQGVEFRVLEQRPGWLSIELPDGKSGWIRADAAGLL